MIRAQYNGVALTSTSTTPGPAPTAPGSTNVNQKGGAQSLGVHHGALAVAVAALVVALF